MQQCSNKPLGLFGVAMLFSVPFTMFMWSLLTFMAAVLGFSFQHWTLEAGMPLVTTTVIPVLAILAWMWWFFASWQSTHTVVQVVRRGFVRNGKPLRPARVGVARGTA